MGAVIFDASYLIPLLDPRVKGISDNPRVNHLFATLEKAKAKIIIPTPALSEVLIGAGDAAPKYLEIINRSARFKVVPFGERAAVEAAAAHREAIDAGNKKEGDISWAKIKFDRQIMAIAKVEGADCIYSDDGDLVRLGQKDGISVVALDQLPHPPAPASSAQFSMFSPELDLDDPPVEPPLEVPVRTAPELDLDDPPVEPPLEVPVRTGPELDLDDPPVEPPLEVPVRTAPELDLDDPPVEPPLEVSDRTRKLDLE
jgi:predicted nucleic acid-binding protein